VCRRPKTPTRWSQEERRKRRRVLKRTQAGDEAPASDLCPRVRRQCHSPGLDAAGEVAAVSDGVDVEGTVGTPRPGSEQRAAMGTAARRHASACGPRPSPGDVGQAVRSGCSPAADREGPSPGLSTRRSQCLKTLKKFPLLNRTVRFRLLFESRVPRDVWRASQDPV